MASNESSVRLGGSLDRSPIGVSTRSRTRSILFRTAAARLRSASVPTRPRKSNVTTNAPRESYGAGNSRPYEYPVFGLSSPIRVGDPQFVSSTFREIMSGTLEEMTVHTSPLFEPFTVEDSHSSAGSSPSSPQRRNEEMSSQPSYSMVAPVMVIEGDNMEEQLNKMKAILEDLQKENEEKSKQIAALTKKLEKRPISSIQNEDSDYASENDDDRDKDKSFTAKDVQKMIAEAFKSQFDGNFRSVGNHRYVKPYSKRIDYLRMPISYQPPKFQQFDGKGNPKQHIAHFIETCNTAGTDGDLLVKQFVRSLKGTAFDWYTDLSAESIDSWDQMEKVFLNRFYSTRRIVSMTELTNTKQWKDEPVIDYISRWRSLSLECKDRLSETSVDSGPPTGALGSEGARKQAFAFCMESPPIFMGNWNRSNTSCHVKTQSSDMNTKQSLPLAFYV